MTDQASATEPGWLRRSVTRLFAIVGVFLFPVAVGVGWSLDAVGGVYQVMGVLIAGIGVPVVEPWLTERERGLDGLAREAARFVQARRAAWREWLRRRRGGPHRVVIAPAIELSAAGGISVASGATADLTVTRPPDAEIAILKQRVASLEKALEKARAEDAADFRRQLAAQREELRAHTVSVTQQGWQYILSGAACSAFGTVLALVA
jgi:hypothetical protein